MEALTKAFVVAEEEGLVPLQRPSQSSAKLVAFEGRVGGLSKEIPGVQHVVPDELEKIAMQLIGAGHGHDADLSARPFSVFGAVGSLEDVEFADSIYAQQQAADAS